MVGSGFLRPDMKKLKAETPNGLRPVMEHCMKKNREERPLFPEILYDLDKVKANMPRLIRSASEPCVNVSQANYDDIYDDFYINGPPKTPIHPPGSFMYANHSNTLRVS